MTMMPDESKEEVSLKLIQTVGQSEVTVAFLFNVKVINTVTYNFGYW